jgi:hypothetical protein
MAGLVASLDTWVAAVLVVLTCFAGFNRGRT